MRVNVKSGYTLVGEPRMRKPKKKGWRAVVSWWNLEKTGFGKSAQAAVDNAIRQLEAVRRRF